MEGGREDSGTTGGWRDDGRQKVADDSTSATLDATLGT